MKNVTFGAVAIAEIRSAANGNGKLVKLTQAQTSSYTGPRSAFQRALGVSGTDATYQEERTSTEWLSSADAAALAVGQVIPGVHIVRIRHASPQWDGHTPAGDGSYISSEVVDYDGNGDRPADIDRRGSLSAATPSVTLAQADATPVEAGA